MEYTSPQALQDIVNRMKDGIKLKKKAPTDKKKKKLQYCQGTSMVEWLLKDLGEKTIISKLDACNICQSLLDRDLIMKIEGNNPKRFAEIDSFAFSDEAAEDLEIEIILKNSPYNQILDVGKAMGAEGGIQLKEKKHRLRKYKNCFSGSEALDWLQTNIHIDKQADAAIIAQKLQNKGYIINIISKTDPFNDKAIFRFSGEVLSGRVLENDEDEDISEDAERSPSPKPNPPVPQRRPPPPARSSLTNLNDQKPPLVSASSSPSIQPSPVVANNNANVQPSGLPNLQSPSLSSSDSGGMVRGRGRGAAPGRASLRGIGGERGAPPGGLSSSGNVPMVEPRSTPPPPIPSPSNANNTPPSSAGNDPSPEPSPPPSPVRGRGDIKPRGMRRPPPPLELTRTQSSEAIIPQTSANSESPPSSDGNVTPPTPENRAKPPPPTRKLPIGNNNTMNPSPPISPKKDEQQQQKMATWTSHRKPPSIDHNTPPPIQPHPLSAQPPPITPHPLSAAPPPITPHPLQPPPVVPHPLSNNPSPPPISAHPLQPPPVQPHPLSAKSPQNQNSNPNIPNRGVAPPGAQKQSNIIINANLPQPSSSSSRPSAPPRKAPPPPKRNFVPEQSIVLQNIDTNDELGLVKMEFLSLEQAYVNSCLLGLSVYNNIDPSQITEYERESIFANMTDIINFHKNILHSSQLSIGDLLLTLIPNFRGYWKYIANLSHSFATVKKLNDRGVFDSILEHEVNAPTIESFLETPMRHLGEYPSLIRDYIQRLQLKDSNEVAKLEKAMVEFDAIYGEVKLREFVPNHLTRIWDLDFGFDAEKAFAHGEETFIVFEGEAKLLRDSSGDAIRDGFDVLNIFILSSGNCIFASPYNGYSLRSLIQSPVNKLSVRDIATDDCRHGLEITANMRKLLASFSSPKEKRVWMNHLPVSYAQPRKLQRRFNF